MISPSSSTAGDTSDLSAQLQKTIERATTSLPKERADRIRAIQERIEELDRRGFLKRQQFRAPTTGDFERMFAAAQRQF